MKQTLVHVLNCERRITAMAFCRNPFGGYWLLTLSEGGMMNSWDMGSFSCVAESKLAFAWSLTAYSDSGMSRFYLSEDYGVTSWQLNANGTASRAGERMPGVDPRRVCTDSAGLVAVSCRDRVRVWHPPFPDGAVCTIPTDGHASDLISLSSDGKMLACGTDTSFWLRVWRVSDQRSIYSFEHPKTVRAVEFSPGNDRLATALFRGNIHLWNLDTGSLERILEPAIPSLHMNLAFHPSGRYLAACYHSTDRLLVWDIQSGELSLALGHHANHNRVAWSPDGQYLLCGSESGEIHVWAMSE